MGIESFFEWLNGINNKEFYLRDEHTNSEFKIQLSKEDNGLCFELEYPNFKLLYDNNSKFSLNDGCCEIRINNYIEAYTSLLTKRKCRSYIFESVSFNSEIDFYHKYYSKIDGDLFYFFFLQGNRDKVSIKIGEEIYGLSIYLNPYSKERYLVIECSNKLTFRQFKHVANNIIVGIGFISGYYYRLEEHYFQSSDITFQSIDFFCRFSNQKSTIFEPISSYPKNYIGVEINDELLNKYSGQLSIDNFTDLINFLLSRTEIYSAIINLFKIYKGYPLFTLSMLFVILETICVQINKECASEYQDMILVKQKGLEIIKKIQSQISIRDYDDLSEVIDQVDSKLIENLINFERACQALGVKLSNEERKVLKKRNELFHGRIIPVIENVNSEEDHQKIELDYAFYSDRIYVIIAKLLLKKINFTGFILNHPKIRERETNRYLNESYFIKI
ncbi:hypothetical protein R1T16_13040 [Flavobacterium sp. DG1-102-2]|uniref:hypothetical protein n=1 Tax=Flavobacterium sp. DG1-102-2 TaxID=3081663 RepID=UPI00294A68BF|nr:hypothetical protein [Flavobacterium sp. DG1-102-2]MDV6169354.1 hypothetical protein [Flavobacterium sp. DG1-102-2]